MWSKTLRLGHRPELSGPARRRDDPTPPSSLIRVGNSDAVVFSWVTGHRSTFRSLCIQSEKTVRGTRMRPCAFDLMMPPAPIGCRNFPGGVIAGIRAPPPIPKCLLPQIVACSSIRGYHWGLSSSFACAAGGSTRMMHGSRTAVHRDDLSGAGFQGARVDQSRRGEITDSGSSEREGGGPFQMINAFCDEIR